MGGNGDIGFTTGAVNNGGDLGATAAAAGFEAANEGRSLGDINVGTGNGL